MRLRYTPEAIADLQAIKEYIRDDLRNPIAANNVVKRILEHCSILKDQPQAGPSLQNKIDLPTELRYWICGNYIAIYRIDEAEVSVARILGARQDYVRLLFGDELAQQ